jgi:alkylhydroperoxidase family enzyme
VDAVLENPKTAPISEREKVLLAFIERVNGASHGLRAEEVDAVRAAGWTDEAIYDAVSVCALFNFYNRWCDGTGVRPMKPEQYDASGKRLASFGYLPPAGTPK